MASIRKRGDKWQARVQRIGFPDVAKSFAQKNDAERWVRHTEAAMDKGGYLPTAETERTTVGDALQRYLTEITPHKKGARTEKYRIAVLLRSKLARLSVGAVRAWM